MSYICEILSDFVSILLCLSILHAEINGSIDLDKIWMKAAVCIID